MTSVTMTDEQEIQKLRDLSDMIGQLRQLTAPETPEKNLKLASAIMRHLLDDFHNEGWRKLGLEPKNATIPAKRVPRSENIELAYVTDANDGVIPQTSPLNKGQFMPVTILAKNEMGDDLPLDAIAHDAGQNYFIQLKSGAPPLGLDFFHDMEPHPFTLHEFWQSAGVVIDGVAISRQEIIRFIANKKGVAHSGKVGAKDKEHYILLEKLSSRDPIYGRDTVFLIFMSICQNFLSSPDIQRFESACKETLPPSGRR